MGGWFLESGRTQAKVGVNSRPLASSNYGVNFVVFDNKHLTTHGVDYFLSIAQELYIVTSNPNHPAYRFDAPSLHIMFYPKSNPRQAFEDLYQAGCHDLVIESGGTLNAVFLRSKLIDYVDIIVAPILVGGKNTPSLIDGLSLILPTELNELGVLKLIDVNKLEDSYLRLRYQVIA
jgi:2,5-diamino-6-(ribosylamino)-4(3H)-pyrimidinone 5'-phosphate reductase